MFLSILRYINLSMQDGSGIDFFSCVTITLEKLRQLLTLIVEILRCTD